MKKHISLPALVLGLVYLLPLPSSSQQLLFTSPVLRVPFHKTVDENSNRGIVVNTVTDNDPNSAGKIYNVVYQGSDHAFYSTRVPGQAKWNIILNRTLDYETQTSMDVVFQATGTPGQNVDSTPVSFKLHVGDLNDNPPQFQNLPYNAEVDEDAVMGTSINISILATDMDTAAGGTVRYELEAVSQGSSQDSGSTFIMDAQNGHVTLNGPLDYESRTFYHYRVIARDQGTPSLSSTTDLFITVKDVQDSPPVFLNIPYFASVPENSAVGSSVLTVRADDQDRAIPNGVTYSITHSTCAGLFRVNGHTGIISVSGQLDRDTAPLKGVDGRCTLGLKATEQNGSYPQKGNFTAVASASISVDDLNDNHPFFPHGYFTASMSENSPPGTPVQLDSGQQIIVTDIDQGPNSAIELSLVSGQDTYELTTSRIQSNGSVQLRVRDNAQLDYERVQSLVVKISASDGGPGHSAVTATVMVSVTNVNEYSPQFLQPRYTAMVPEGSAPGTYVTTVNATDRDIGDYGSITYTLTNARGIFTIDARSGAVAVNSSDTDREREDRYDLMVVATDGGGLQQAVPLTLRLSDVNDNPPVFLRRQYDVTLREDSLQFSRPVTLQATDADQKGTENANVTYAIRSTLPAGLQSHFRLAPFTGQLTVFQKLDYDTIQFPPAGSDGVVEVVVAATDNGQPAKRSASATVMITLIDVNDNDPVLHNAPFTTTIAERTSAGSFVFNVSASDADGSAPNNLITYAIESGGQDRFRINPDTGTVSVSGDLDREQLSSYTLVIVARDRASAPRSASSQMTIRIADVNDELPSFGTKENARISVNEGTRGVLYDMSAADSDLNSALQYRIVYRDSSAQPGGLRVEDWMEINANTGEVMAKETLDRTAVQMFVLRVQVTDTNGSVNTPQTTNATLTVTVVDINNHSPRFIPQGTVSASIRENMGKGTALTFTAPLRVSDLDEGDNSKFSVSVTGSSSPYFEVLPATVLSSADLLIRVKNNSVLDYEARTSLNITLLARETETAEHRTGTVTISLSLEDENDHSPHFVNETYHAAIPEALPAGTSVTTVTATDGDRSTEFSTITYSLQGAENLFTINPSTGEVTLLTNSTDYDTLPNTYQLTVLASDNEGRRGNALLTVSLTDINDLSPHFDRSEYTAALREGSTQFESPPLVKAVDGDEPGTPNSNITYTILRSDPAGLKSRFILGNRYSGAIDVVSSLDLESLPPSGLVSLTLQATDGGGRSSTSSVVITVLDVNDHTPQFSSGPSSPSAVSVLENATVGTLVHTFTATDGDRTSPNNNVTFLISSGANDQFSLDADGHLTVSRHLDRETVASYSLVVLALDKGVPQNTGTTTLSLLISDVNDVSPHFLRSSVSVPVEENTAGVVYTMSATDDDVDHRLSYGIVSAEGFHSGSLLPSRFTIPFAINPSTGAISINGQLDRETLDSAVLVIRVQDLASQNGPQTATGTVSISVGDRDDNAPRFTQSSLRVSVDENAAKGVPLTMPQLSVTDSDQGVNAEFRLSVTEHMRGTIDVVPSTATGSTVLVLRVGANNDMLDYEANPSIHFQIWAEGTVNPNRSSHCNVTLDINNLNDFLPQFQRQEYTASINESTATGTSVTTVKATDGDSGDLGNVSYSILGDNALFSVENASGLITTIAAPEHYNFEKTPEYYLTVMATDGGGATTTTRVHVSLEDINDQKPVFRQSEYSAFLKENSPTFDRGVTVKATDNDKENTPNSEVLYSLPGSSSFTVNATSGEVGIRWPVDYESVSGGVVRLTVYATDRGSPPLSSSVEVVVTVQDENDFPPVFEHTTYVRNVTEGTPTDTHVVTVNATDGDGSAPNNEVFYLLASGGNDKFRMDSGSGRLSTIGDIDRETRASYTLIIQAVDKGSPPKTATTTVIVQVDNINDDVPRFLPQEVSVTVPEGEAPGTVVRAFSAVDNDEDAALSYQVLWNRSSGYDEDLNSVSEDVLKDAFSIDQTTGIIRINRGLDRETIETATLVIHVQDLHAPVLSTIIQTATGTVNIQVSDIDDHAPSFTSQQYSASIPETSPEGVPIHLPVPIRVSDPDKGTNSEFRLSLSTDCLRISPSSARGEATVVISVARLTCFDYETQESTDFRVIAEGEGERNFTTNASVHLYINNTNDGTPRFSQSMYSKSILENLNVSTSVLTVEATDSDKPPYNAFYYTLQGGDNVFSINNETGVVSVAKAKLDYETRQEYRMTVEATDSGGLRASVPLTITLTDLNDNPPQFARLEYRAFVDENRFDFDRPINITATDSDTGLNGEIRYTISPTSQLADNFTIDNSTGSLGIREASSGLDYEALPDTGTGIVHLTVVACDLGTPSLCSNVSVFVTVRDENDNEPIFGQSYDGNISENAVLGTPLLTVSARDSDGSAPNNKVFYVISGSGSDKFKVDSSSGNITRAGQLDSDTTAFYNLTVSAIDGGSPAKSSSTFVTVHVLDVNDVPPEFKPKSESVDVVESNGLQPGASERVVANMWATDPDQDKELSYHVLWSECRGFGVNQETLEVSSLQNVFEVDSSSGEVKVLNNSLDREKLSRAVLVVSVTDLHAVGPPQVSTGSLTINVKDVNDHKPQFNQPSYTAQIAENAVKDSILHIVSTDQMNVTDLDTDQDHCVFRITVDGPESAYFTAEPSTARSFALVQLRVRNGSVLDYEQRHNITFNVTVTETSTNESFSDTVVVTVSITDVNDNTPWFGQNYSVSIKENSPAHTNITRIQAFDEDSGSFGKITYSLEGDAARFSIDPTTGDIETADGRLDRETRDTYLMTVVATDGGGRRAGTPLTITVTDDNDQVPRFQGNYSTKVLENTVSLIPPVVLQAKDEDLANTPNSNVTYHLHTCVPVACGNFTLDEVSGQLTLNTELDFERTTGVELVVLAHDQGTVQLTGTATVIIDVQDVNDVDPTFTQNSYSVDIYENSEEGTVVGRVSANDGDRTSPNNVVFYVLDSGRGSDRFRVNSTTGIVTVGPGALLDREADDSFSLQLLALDRGDPPRSSTTTLSVSLLDVNDEKPFFGQERRAVHLREDVAVGHVVEVMNATDHDEDSSLVYSWELGESRATTDRDVRVNISRVSTWFSVNASTGLVTVSSELDRELAEIIVMKIMVNDTNGIKKLPQTALASLTITLTDVNDNRPVIKGSTSLRVSEALAEGTEVASYSARDADRDQSVTFSILSEGEAYFNISSAGKLSLQHQIDREKTPSVNFTVIATDSGSPPLTSNITIKVTVLDANDNDPQFQNTSYVFSVSENAPENTLVVVINATDRDEGANANVTFDFADNVYDFVMNKTTGEILVHKPLDRETRASYSFGIAALDNPVTDVKRRTIQQVTITVGDVNDNAPTFTSLGLGYDGYTAQIDETKESGDKVLNVQPGPVRASDDDEGSNSALSFSLASKDGVDYFRMDPVTGELVVNGSIHGEAGVYNYTVTVTDGGQPPLNTSANLTIEVMDQNLNDPRFEGDYAHIPPIPECSPTETHIVTFTATDDDRNKETNGKVQYFFDNATSNLRDLPYFNLNPDTGLLTSARIFNREQQAHFQIGVIAQDKGVPNIRYSKPLRIRIDIDDGNDNPPKFNVTEYHFVVPEGQEGVRVGQVYAQDLDDFKRTCYTLDGKHKDYFNISTHTDRPADLQLVQALDRENAQQASFSLTVTAIDCTLSTGACDHQDFPPVFANVHITVSDVNDNPPNFTRPHLTFGLTSTANAGHIIANLQEYVADPDLGANRVHAFYPVGYYETDRKLNSSLKSAGSARLLALSVNGSLSTRSALPGDAEGFFTWTIMANDSAGEDTVVVKVYVVGKDKLIKITFFASVEELRQVQDDIVRDMSEQTGLQFVADDREPFEDSSGIDSSKSILVVHAVDKNENAMDANALMDFMDHEVTATDMLKTRYKLYDIQTYKAAESKGMDDRTKMEYILGAIICVLVVAFLITLYLMLSSIRRFKRKLKAARIETYPMTKQHLQHSVPGLKTPQTNPIFGKDEDLATKEVDVDRASTLSDESLDNNSVDINVIKVRSVDSASEDEQEVTLDLYGEDTEQPPSKARGDRSFYLDQALDEHQGRTTPNSLSNGHGPKRNGVTLGLNNGHAHLSQTVDFDLEGCESSDI